MRVGTNLGQGLWQDVGQKMQHDEAAMESRVLWGITKRTEGKRQARVRLPRRTKKPGGFHALGR
ncbi:hypothetical protein D7X32_30665 [Corallococcus carmarthensis]|uniref:Uncharacterized protein n=1 Tax=Corallococcus carmarthensis TaxID=2316728 RepID=A0A3A8JSY6_9BACT|nr:hypothetical protein D7X32_30665 [Corallococcus carmarthensis]